MIIEDFVMLGRTVPEHSRRHGLVVCSAGYSKEYGGFIRIYPLSMQYKIPRWSVCRIEVERPKSDNRKESFRLKNGTNPEITGKVKKEKEYYYLESLQSKSISSLNQDRDSLAIIKPREFTYSFGSMKKGEEYQLRLPLFEGEIKETPKPRLQFRDFDGKHDLQIRDWGCAVLLKRGYGGSDLWDALYFTKSNYEHILFCGNHNSYRNSWLVISVISRKIQTNMRIDF